MYSIVCFIFLYLCVKIQVTIGLGKKGKLKMAKVGYARVSSKEQNLERQIEKLEKVTRKIFKDKASGKTVERDGLDNLLNYIRDGDIVVITELDRLSRNYEDLSTLIQKIQGKGASLEVLNLPSLSGIKDDNLRKLLNNLILELYKYQAQAERERIRERQRQGIELAKKQGRYSGRKPKFQTDDARLLHAFELFKSGKTDREVERLTGINTRTFRRYRKKYGISR